MHIQARVLRYTDEVNFVVVHDYFKLAEIPVSENCISINNTQYKVCQTVFRDKNTQDSFLTFEQLIWKMEINESGFTTKEYLTLEGELILDEPEIQALFKTIVIVRLHEKLSASILYAYLRRYDCIQISNLVYRIEMITLGDNIEATLNLFSPPVDINNFRKDSLGFCQRLR